MSSHRRDNRAKPTFEKLEDRNLLAGDVTATVNAAGDLLIEGDAANNAVWLEQDPAGADTVLIWGDATTRINGQTRAMASPLPIPGLTGDIRVILGAGSDTFYAMGIDAPGSFSVSSGSGNDRVNVEFGNVSGTLHVRGGRGADALFVEGVTAGERIVVRGDRGRDKMYISSVDASFLDIGGGRGRDRINVHDIGQVDDGKIRGGRGRDYIGSDSGKRQLRSLASVSVGGVENAGRQNGGDVMEVKLDQAIRTLGQRGRPAEHRQAIDQIMESLFTSNLVPLPTNTNGDPQDPGQQEFDEHLERMDRAIEALNDHTNSGRRKSKPQTRAEAADVKNFLQLTQEAMQVIAGQTAFCDPGGQNLIDPEAPSVENPVGLSGLGCPFLEADDEGGAVIDDVLEGIFSRQVRSPFPIIFEGSVGPVEHSFTTEALAEGECAAIVKEFQGVKVVVTPRTIPIWVEPWFARARIVGTQTVWAFEFVPAEFIKTISVCNVGGAVETDVQSVVVHDRALMHFWRFF